MEGKCNYKIFRLGIKTTTLGNKSESFIEKHILGDKILQMLNIVLKEKY